MNFLRSRRGAIVAVSALIVGLFLFRPGAGRLRTRIAATIGQALQRQVEIGSVHIRLLPRPGFDLEDFVVHDDPAFGAEPVLRAQEVTANLRLTSLLRAHLEVSSLSLTEPSLNLVRNEQGHWNIESILEHTAQTAVGPTGQRASFTQPQFPYIEADHGRINFKVGSEKKPLALSDANFAFWQDSDSSWGMRLRAQPVRTDVSLSDTGILRASGTWRRAGRLRETPLQFAIQWDGAQLGQVTKLFSGADRGWRGTVRTVVNLAGEPSDLRITSDASVQDFRRYDLAGGDPLRVGTHCEAHYTSVTREFESIRCASPIGTGQLALTGDHLRFAPAMDYDLSVRGQEIPLAALVPAARRAKRDLPSDLEAEGSLTFRANFRRNEDGLAVTGSGSTKEFKLQSASLKTTLALGEVPLTFSDQGVDRNHSQATHTSNDDGNVPESDRASLVIGPFHAASMPNLALRAELATQGYSFTTTGDADLKHLMLAARTIGIPTPPPVAEGSVKLAMSVAGVWKGFNPPQPTGTAQLRASRIELRALNGPIEIPSATIRLDPDRVEVQSIAATLADSHWKGSLSLPRGCSRLADCRITFNLQADEIVPERLHLFADTTRPSPWYRVLSRPSASPTVLTQLHASGKLKVGRFSLPNFSATHVSSNAEVEAGHLRLSDLTADTLGGKHAGKWAVDFTASSPLYSGTGTFQQVALGQLSAAMQDLWLTGTGNGEYRVEAHGHSLPELLGSAAGTLKFEIHSGNLPHVQVEDESLAFRRFAGALTLRSGNFELKEGSLESATGNYLVDGSATWSRDLDFTLLSDGTPKYAITGTLAAPRVSASAASATRATLQH